MPRWLIALACALLTAVPALADDKAPPLAPGVRGLVTRAPGGGIKVDGKLAEWGNAFCTPVHYNHAKLDDRAAQFYYAWDDSAFYVGLRALDRHRADIVPLASLQDGDGTQDAHRGPGQPPLAEQEVADPHHQAAQAQEGVQRDHRHGQPGRGRALELAVVLDDPDRHYYQPEHAFFAILMESL